VKAFFVLAASISSIAVANVLLKVGMDRLAVLQAAGGITWRGAAGVWELSVGMLLMIVQFAGMLTLFKWGWDASVVVPIFGLNYALTAILSQWFLGEPVYGLRWLGIALVIAGVALIVRSVPKAGPL
jgi:drug/metabolite transporter (DMT)-like permease